MMISPSPRPRIPSDVEQNIPSGLSGQVEKLSANASDVSAYGASFWYAYAANFLFMVGFAILFRYADLVLILGGTELVLGWIVGAGMIGSLFTRFILGRSVDRNGPRLVWMGSTLLFSASCFAHLLLHSCHSPWIYILRICFASSVAGIIGATMAMISSRMKESRIAEMLGMLGTSGFLGMVVGTQVGDLLLGTETLQRWQINHAFVTAGSLGLAALFFIWMATRDSRPIKRQRHHPPILSVLRRYHPGSVLFVGVVMGVTLGMPTTFLRTYAAELDINRIAIFFSVYAPAGFLTRILTRRLPERFGTTRMTLVGLAGLAVSQFLFLGVHSEWGLVLPGVLFGISHAILFPCVIASGSSQFPERYRGLAMMIMLSTYDIGILIGAPMVGLILYAASKLGVPRYPSLFCLTALLLFATLVFHAMSSRRRAIATQKLHRLDHWPTASVAQHLSQNRETEPSLNKPSSRFDDAASTSLSACDQPGCPAAED